jgi:hypothetical protein
MLLQPPKKRERPPKGSKPVRKVILSKTAIDDIRFMHVEAEAQKLIEQEDGEEAPSGPTLSNISKKIISNASFKGINLDELGRELKSKAISREEALELKSLAKHEFEELVRLATAKGIWILGKLLELGEGVKVEREHGIYSIPPNYRALELLMRYGFGSPTGEEKETATPQTDSRTQVNIFLPSNGREAGRAANMPQIESKVVDAKFKEE